MEREGGRKGVRGEMGTGRDRKGSKTRRGKEKGSERQGGGRQ